MFINFEFKKKFTVIEQTLFVYEYRMKKLLNKITIAIFRNSDNFAHALFRFIGNLQILFLFLYDIEKETIKMIYRLRATKAYTCIYILLLPT
jgi:hypothetical protein